MGPTPRGRNLPGAWKMGPGGLGSLGYSFFGGSLPVFVGIRMRLFAWSASFFDAVDLSVTALFGDIYFDQRSSPAC